MCLQEFLEIKPNSSTLMQTLPQTSNNLNFVLLESSNPWIPVHLFELLTRVFDATSGKRIPFDFKNG